MRQMPRHSEVEALHFRSRCSIDLQTGRSSPGSALFSLSQRKERDGGAHGGRLQTHAAGMLRVSRICDCRKWVMITLLPHFLQFASGKRRRLVQRDLPRPGVSACRIGRARSAAVALVFTRMAFLLSAGSHAAQAAQDEPGRTRNPHGSLRIACANCHTSTSW